MFVVFFLSLALGLFLTPEHAGSPLLRVDSMTILALLNPFAVIVMLVEPFLFPFTEDLFARLTGHTCLPIVYYLLNSLLEKQPNTPLELGALSPSGLFPTDI